MVLILRMARNNIAITSPSQWIRMEGGSLSSRKVLETLSVALAQVALELTVPQWRCYVVSVPRTRCWAPWSETSSRTDAATALVLAVWAHVT